jgi:hypothetical protein
MLEHLLFCDMTNLSIQTTLEWDFTHVAMQSECTYPLFDLLYLIS